MMTEPLFRATVLTALAAILQLESAVHASAVRPRPRIAARSLVDLLERESAALKQEADSGNMMLGQWADAVHACYTLIFPPSFGSLTDAEKVDAFDRLRARLYPEGRDPFGNMRGGPHGT